MLSRAATRARILVSRPAGTSSLRRAFPATGHSSIRCSSSSSSSSSDREDHDELWKHVYRDFILKVHPDFFQDFPKERAVNEKSLKAFSQHLERLQAGGGSKSGRPALVFFVKAAGGGGSVENDEDQDTSQGGGGGGGSSGGGGGSAPPQPPSNRALAAIARFNALMQDEQQQFQLVPGGGTSDKCTAAGRNPNHDHRARAFFTCSRCKRVGHRSSACTY